MLFRCYTLLSILAVCVLDTDTVVVPALVLVLALLPVIDTVLESNHA